MKKKLLLISLAFLLAIGLVATACQAPPAPEVIEWDFSLWGPPGARVWPSHPFFVDEIEKRTEGRLKITAHFGAALAPSREQLDGIKAGLFDMAMYAAAYHPGKNPLAYLLTLPAITPVSYEETIRLQIAFMEQPAAQAEMLERWNASYIGLAIVYAAYTFLGDEPIRSMADFEGKSFRVGGIAGKLIEKFGGVGLMVPAPEVYEAISKGTLDQAFFSPPSHSGYKIHEVSKYYTYNVGLGSTHLVPIVVNRDSWDALPEDIKAIVLETAEYVMLEVLPAELGKKIDEIHAEWKASGIEFIDFPAEERAKLVAGAEPLWYEYAAELDADGLPGTEMLEFLLAKKMEIAGS